MCNQDWCEYVRWGAGGVGEDYTYIYSLVYVCMFTQNFNHIDGLYMFKYMKFVD